MKHSLPPPHDGLPSFYPLPLPLISPWLGLVPSISHQKIILALPLLDTFGLADRRCSGGAQKAIAQSGDRLNPLRMIGVFP